ncbi:MAG: PAS domain S-box protein [Rhodoferax sp.]|nr:PAS domain S-box protein [Rhodoferax sp.]
MKHADFLDAILNATTESVLLLDPQGIVLVVNETAASRLGSNQTEILGKQVFDLFPSDLALERRRQFEELIQSGTARQTEDTRAGRVFWTNYYPIKDENQHVSAVVVFAIDVTERRQIEQALKVSERRYRGFAENLPLGIVITQDGLIKYVNKASCQMLGFELAELLGREFLPLICEADRSRVADIHRRRMQGESVTPSYIVGMVRKDGIIRQWSMHVSTIDWEGKRSGLGSCWDVTDSLQAELALRESEERYRTAFVTSPDAINITRLSDGCYIDVNEGFLRLTGWTREEVIGKTALELKVWANPADRQHLVDALRRDGYYENLEATFLGKDGRAISGLMSAHIMTIKGVDCLLSVTRDISERKTADDKLKLAASVFSHAREGIMITDAAGEILDVNDMFTDITGYRREDVVGQNPRILKSGRQSKEFYTSLWGELVDKGHWYGEIWNRRKNGEVYPQTLTISAVRNATAVTQNYVALFSDITAQKAHQGQLEHIAHYDALTNLPNRVLLADRLKQALTQALRREERLAVAYLDLDGFKLINDRHGHQVGDQLLIELSRAMKQCLRDGDTLARLGGDEFVAVLIDLDDLPSGIPMLRRILAAAAQPVQIGELTLNVSASLGVTFYPQTSDIDADQLLRQADHAMYQAKVAGKNRYHVFDPTQDISLRVQHESLERIRLALSQQEFVLYYQPKVNMRTGRVVGVEALIRWRHPEEGLLAPDAFLPVIENHPLAVAVGEWVIESALTQMESWRAAGLALPVSVNVGARQLQQSDFLDRLKVILARHQGVEPSDLQLEILETSALEDISQVSQLIESCADMGVSFALDDFGTGYSSLTYLKRLRVNALKIDQSFVRDMLDDEDDLAILEGVIGLASAFKRQVIAEGVETAAHGASLMDLGCDVAQGYGIARPMPASELPAWVASWRPDPSWGRP